MTGFHNGSRGFGLILSPFSYPGSLPGILPQINMRLEKDPALLEDSRLPSPRHLKQIR